VAPDITFYRERKLRLLNAVHTATTPLALLAGVRTVREASAHPLLAAFQKRLLFDEIIPATDIPADDARAFAHQVLERFANPWLEHEYRVIATNQEEKFRIRVLPLILASFRTRAVAEPALQRTDKTPGSCLALASAAHLTFTRARLDALGDAARIPEFAAATTRWMAVIAEQGVETALSQLVETAPCS
jgi:mannitol-1-phosphate/altronate dehydrogenase